MNTCKSCRYLTPSKNHNNQGLCNKIVQVGTIHNYDEGKLTLTADQPVGIINFEENHRIIILVNTETFGCVLHEKQEKVAPEKEKAVPEKEKVTPAPAHAASAHAAPTPVKPHEKK